MCSPAMAKLIFAETLQPAKLKMYTNWPMVAWVCRPQTRLIEVSSVLRPGAQESAVA